MITIFYKLSFFLGGIVPLLLGFFIYIKNKKAVINKTYLGLSLACAVWSLGFFALLSSNAKESAYVWRMFMDTGAVILPAFWMHFIYSMLDSNAEKKKEIIVYYSYGIFLIILNFADYIFPGLFVQDIIAKNGFNYYPTAGPGYYLFVLFYIIIVPYSLYYLIKSHLKSSGVEAQQIKYLIIAAFFGFGGGVTAFFLTFNVPIAPYGAFLFIFYPVIIAYSINRHHLFDIKVVTTELFVAALSIVALARTAIAENAQDRIINGLLFAAITVVGFLLIRSVLKEVKQREQIEKMAEDVKRAYEVEKRANEELKKLDEIKNQFLMQTQHDLRTPLSTIRGYCDLLLNGTFGKQPKQTIEVLERIEVVAEDKIKDVNNFLDVTQFQLGKKVVNLSPGINLNEILAEIQDRLEPNAAAKGIYLKLEKPESAIIVEADREKLKSALFNVVDNSIKYTVNGGITIKISNFKNLTPNTQHPTPKVLIEIKDTGVGMSKEQCQKLFDTPFQRGEQAKKMSATGKGVGLYLSGKIIAEHKGKIWAESEGEEKGSTFYIELPVS